MYTLNCIFTLYTLYFKLYLYFVYFKLYLYFVYFKLYVYFEWRPLVPVKKWCAHDIWKAAPIEIPSLRNYWSIDIVSLILFVMSLFCTAMLWNPSLPSHSARDLPGLTIQTFDQLIKEATLSVTYGLCKLWELLESTWRGILWNYGLV